MTETGRGLSGESGVHGKRGNGNRMKRRDERGKKMRKR